MDQGQATHATGTRSAPAGFRVGVDGFNLAMPRGTGVATYGRVLTQALAGMGHPVDMLYGANIGPRTPALLREVMFFDSLDQEAARKRPGPMTPRWIREVLGDRRASTAVQVPITGRVLSEPFRARMPAYDRIMNIGDLWGRAERHFKLWGSFMPVRIPDPPAVMHWTYPLPIRLVGAHNVYTLHDLVPLRMPYTTLDNKRLYTRLIRGCLAVGDHVCTVSEASRQDIIDLFGVPPGRITNTWQSAIPAPALAPVQTEAELGAWLYGLFGLEHGGYFLFFGALEPKKNVGRLLEAYLSSGIQTPLVIVGGRAWKSEAEMRLVQAPGGLSAATRVRQFEYMPRPWLTALIRGARGVMFPSLYEGFGLPVLEAMQLGTPVITSTESSLPEVAGEAALLVNPYDTGAIAGAMRRLDNDPALRERLSAAGLAQAERFSVPAYQGRLETLYAAVLAGLAGVPVVAPSR